MIGWLIPLLPVKYQAQLWARHMHRTRGHTSHWRLEAYKALRASAKLPLSEAKRLIDVYAPK